MMRINVTSQMLLLGGLVLPASSLFAQVAAEPTNPATPNVPSEVVPAEAVAGEEQAQSFDFQEITDELDLSVDQGLAYLAAQQNEDGSFDADRYRGPHVGVTAICCLAFMAHGELPGRGEYGYVVQNGLDYILANSTASGLIASENVSHGPMYGHGFATLFLGQIYGMSQDEDVRDALVKAVRLIVNSQNAEGGWRYHPIPFDADLSVTICQIKALRSARQAGINVPRETIDNAIQYVQDCQNPYNGGFRYMIGGGSSGFPRSAAGVASLYYAGVYEGDEINEGLDYLHAQMDSGEDRGSHEFYGHYYCAQAMFIAGGEHWARYFPVMRQRLIDQQNADGSWDSPHGRDYATGMSLIVLEMPYRLLPIFQR